MKRYLCCAFVWLMSVGSIASGQPRGGTIRPPTCSEDLGALEQKLYDDYAGFRLEVKNDKALRYNRMATALRKTAASTASQDCLPVLKKYLDWFDDPHLFIYQNPAADSVEAAIRARQARVIMPIEGDARALFRNPGRHLDPIEGIWYDKGLRVAILQNRDGKDLFSAFVVAPDTAGWPVGSLRATFARKPNGGYSASISLPNHSLEARDAVIYRKTLLRIAPTLWAKEFPVNAAESGLLAGSDPRRPTVTLHGQSVVVAIPSHDPSYKSEFDSLIAAHDLDLRRARRIIVDLRGNEGGSSFMSDALLPYILTASKRPSRYETDFGKAVILSSPDQVSYAHWGFGSDTTAFARSLIARMQAHKGELVPLTDPSAAPEPETPDSVIDGGWKVGVLIDRGTVSASEVMVLKALKSRRATVFGEPTEGALDYQSNRIVWFSPRERRWGLGYPTITAHANLPIGGMRGKGIVPDVRIDLDSLPDPVATVERLLDRQPHG
jgi:hypothetical protein